MYAILKIIVRLSLRVYFRKITIQGKEKITKNGPYILIANHPSAFTDPIAIGVHIKPTIYFLAAGEYMGKGLKYRFMSRFLNMIPIYRPETMPQDISKNTDIFAKCIAHLNKGRSILVFPEGISQSDKKVAPFKTGVARIVQATEFASQLKANIQIIPIGLNYSDPHQFRSDLFMNVGDPINAADFFSDNPENAINEINALTKKMEEELIKTVLHIENSEHEDLLTKVNESYMRDLKSELGVNYSDQHREFELNKLMISAFNYFQNEQPAAYAEMKIEIDDYFKLLAQHGIKDRELRKINSGIEQGQLFFLIFGAPLFLIGFAGNFLPYDAATFLQRKFNVKDAFRGSIILAVGMIMFLFWYVGIVVCLWIFTPLSFFSLLVPFVFYLTGIFALIYASVAKYRIKKSQLRNYFKDKKELRDQLLDKREKLISKFETLRVAFDTR